MIDLSRSWSIRPRLAINTMVLLIAAIASCLALCAAGYGFVPELRSAVARPALVAVVAWWSLAAALPALWVGDVRRASPERLLFRFVIGNGFLATFVTAGSPLLVVMLLGIAALVRFLDPFVRSLMAPGPGRVRVKMAMASVSSYVIQLALTLALFIVTLLPLGYM
jgi:hypothetical protein